MKHLVFLVGGYYPNFSAVGNCAEKIINKLKDDYKITVISIKGDIESAKVEEFDGYKISRVESQYQNKLNFLQNKIQNGGNVIYKLGVYLTRLANLGKFLLKKESIDSDLVHSYFDELSKLNSQNKIDAIVPLVFPFETVLAAIDFKKHIADEVKLFPYLFDNFAASVSLHRFKINRAIKYNANVKLEGLLSKYSNTIFAMHPLTDYFKRHFNQDLVSKITFLEHPLLFKRSSVTVNQCVDDKILLTYTGGLFKRVRTSDGILDFLSEVNEVQKFKVNFYCFGNDLIAIDKYSKNSPEIFSNFGKVSRDIAETAISNSDILISIGDMEGKQLSSKIFDYLSMGKPILHFSYVEDCVNAKLLERYPLAFVVCKRNKYSNLQIQESVRFIKQTSGSCMPFSEVEKLYPEALPITSANIFKQKIES